MQVFNFLPSLLATLGFLAITVCADGASIVAAINKVTDDTANLNNTVLAWQGDLLGLIPIVSDSQTLLNDINAGTKTAQASSNLTVLESIGVYTATLALSSAVNQTLITIEETKPKFDDLLLVSPVILANLKEEKQASDQFSAAIISKVPTDLQPIANNVVAGIDAEFDQAIAIYQQFSL